MTLMYATVDRVETKTQHHCQDKDKHLCIFLLKTKHDYKWFIVLVCIIQEGCVRMSSSQYVLMKFSWNSVIFLLSKVCPSVFLPQVSQATRLMSNWCQNTELQLCFTVYLLWSTSCTKRFWKMKRFNTTKNYLYWKLYQFCLHYLKCVVC